MRGGDPSRLGIAFISGLSSRVQAKGLGPVQGLLGSEFQTSGMRSKFLR